MGLLDSLTKKLLPKNDDSKSLYISSGWARLELSNYNDALFSFDSALEIDANCEDGWIGRAFTFHKLGKIDEAVIAYEKFIELVPDAFTPWRPEGKVRDNLPFYEKAFEAHMLALKGNTAKKLGHYAKSEEFYVKAREIMESTKR
jgi:tetratricopeptide (TPR) repeat protein